MRDDTKPRVATLLKTHLGVDDDKIVDSATIQDDLGADSLDLVELEMAFEEEFGFRFPAEAINKGVLGLDMTVERIAEIVDEARTD
jgi:acyl carrier protein